MIVIAAACRKLPTIGRYRNAPSDQDRSRPILFCQGRQQAALHLPKIRGVIRETALLRFKFRPGCDDIHLLRRYALRFREQIGIETLG